MKNRLLSEILPSLDTSVPAKHPKCLGYTDEWTREFDCEYQTSLECTDCKYGGHGGRKDPEAKVNQL